MSTRSRNRLLVVEDDDICRESMRSVFRQMDFEITMAASVAEGLAALDPPPSCVLLDLKLPDGSGVAILERIRAHNLPSRVVVCTGDDDDARLKAVRSLEPTAILKKPLALSELIAACRIPAGR